MATIGSFLQKLKEKSQTKGILNINANQTFTEFEAKKSVEFNVTSNEIFNYQRRDVKSSGLVNNQGRTK